MLSITFIHTYHHIYIFICITVLTLAKPNCIACMFTVKKCLPKNIFPMENAEATPKRSA